MISIDARWDSNRGALDFTRDLASFKALCWKPCLAIVKENLVLSFVSPRLELVTGSGFGNFFSEVLFEKVSQSWICSKKFETGSSC